MEQPWDNGFYRSFLAASYKRLWPRCSQQANHERHYYEVLFELQPCFMALLIPGLHTHQCIPM